MRRTKKHFEKRLKNIPVVITALFVALLFIGNAAATSITTDNTIAIKTNQINDEKTLVKADTTESEPTIRVDHDMGVISVNELESGVGQPFIPTVTVENLGDNDETNIPVNLQIGTWVPINQTARSYYDFEYDDGGFIPSATWDPIGDWEYTDSYDVTNYNGTHTPPPTAHSGDGMWGTVINGDYTNSGGLSFLNKTIDFSGVSNASMSFYSWSDIFGSFDYGMVKINGVELLRIDDYNPTDWTFEQIDLSVYSGQIVELSFAFYATTVVEYAGWYIDDLSINDVPTQFVPEYNETVTVDALSGEIINATFPQWTPVDLGVAEFKSIRYSAFAEINCPGDNNSDNDVGEKHFTLEYGHFHDLELSEVVSPTSGTATIFTPEALVNNIGQNDETNVDVTMLIEKIQLNPPFWTQVQYSGTGEWTQSAYGSHTYEPGGTGTFYANCWDTGPATQFDTGLFTYGYDFTGMTSVTVEFWRNFQDYATYGQAAVNTYSGGINASNFEEQLLYLTNDDSPTTGIYTTLTFNPQNYTDPSEVYIEWWYTDDQYTSTAWGFGIDDVKISAIGYYESFENYFPPATLSYIEEYNETITLDFYVGDSINVIFPDWTPNDIVFADISYRITTTVDLPIDGDQTNNQIIDVFTLEYIHDVGTEEIFPFPHEASRDPWDLYYSFDLEAASGALGNAGAEFDGNHFYSTRWATNLIHQYDETGNLVKEFSITGVTGLRDLAYNPNTGTFYGGAAAGTIWEMDFDSETLISTITGGFLSRAIAYNPDDDVIYCSNWGDPVWVVDPATGTIIDQFNLATAVSTYGMAYDNDGTSRYLYVFDQGAGAGTPQYIYQWDLDAGAMTGFSYDVTVDFPTTAGIAGGLFVSGGLDPNNVVIGGCLQGTPDMMFAYELRPGDGGGGGTVYEPGTYPVEGVVENYGSLTETDIPVHAEITNETGAVWYSDDLIVPMLLVGEQAQVIFTDVTFDDTADTQNFKLTIETQLPGDDVPGNNKKTWSFTILIPDTVPPETTHNFDGILGNDDWYVSDVTVTLDAVDYSKALKSKGPPSGVNHTYYKLDGGAETEYTGPFAVSDDGTHTIQYRSVDKVGNWEDWSEEFDFKIDQTVPVIVNLTVEKVAYKTYLISAIVEDATSGVAKVEFFRDDALLGEVTEEPWEWEYTGSSGTHIVKIIVYDAAGNQEISEEIEATVVQNLATTQQTTPITA